jgi:hypothetical protein
MNFNRVLVTSKRALALSSQLVTPRINRNIPVRAMGGHGHGGDPEDHRVFDPENFNPWGWPCKYTMP